MKIKSMISIGLIIGFIEAQAGIPASIDGVSFKDWAAANVYITRGMPKEEVSKILGVSVDTWESVNKKWPKSLRGLAQKDFSIMKTLGTILKNPKVGKFSNINEYSSIEKFSKKVPTYDKFLEISTYLSSTASKGMKVDLEKEYGLTIQEWSQVSMHWSDYMNKKFMMNASNTERVKHRKEMQKFIEYDKSLRKKWSKYFKIDYNR